ncbi:hypothetical protein HPB49_000582 [Dermacentor silvarum]|uniref:Uncharacterized protein n=1 Tax=Dermacentor silvarum TaxID=543639 RepID=A0ACB8DSK4_DERSI|nr:hypothetical protein HPB49_000582 [Dermacentor silvarum]
MVSFPSDEIETSLQFEGRAVLSGVIIIVGVLGAGVKRAGRIRFARLACVCAICWVLPDKIMNLPCGHAVCLACWYNPYYSTDKPHQDSKALSMFRSGVCPMDEVPFVDPELEDVTCPKGVYNTLVFCVNNVFGCRSIVELGHLKAHCLQECRFNPMTCILCGRDDTPKSMTEQNLLLCARW